MRFKSYALPVLLALLPISNALASAQTDFQAGIQQFKARQFPQAIRSFEHARQQGMKSPALYYNLAVSYFKTGDYQQAKVWFNQSRQFPLIKPLSEYNLGLVAIKQGETKIALEYFKGVATTAREKNLVTLANYQIDQLRQQSPKSWSAFIQLKYGHDDNVTTATDASPTKRASNFVDLYAYGSVNLLGTAKQGLAINAYVFDTSYKTVSQYDMQVRDLGASQSFAVGKTRNSAAINFQQTTLAGKDFQKAVIYDLKTRYLLNTESDVRLRYRYYDIDSVAPYQELTGNKQRLRLEYRRFPGLDKLKLYYEYETNDRSETTATLSSYSPTRHTLRGAYTYAFSDKLALTGDLAYRTSHYPAGATNLARDETRAKTNLQIDYNLNRVWYLSAEYDHVDNGSTDPAYRYKENISAVSINASF